MLVGIKLNKFMNRVRSDTGGGSETTTRDGQATCLSRLLRNGRFFKDLPLALAAVVKTMGSAVPRKNGSPGNKISKQQHCQATLGNTQQ